MLVSEDDIEAAIRRPITLAGPADPKDRPCDRHRLPGRRALLGEGGHALGGVGSGEQLVGQRPHPVERLVALEGRHGSQHPLGLGHGTGRAHADAVAQRGDRRVDVVGDVGDEADVAGEGGVERLAGQEGGGEPAAARPAQDRHRDDRRGHADAHLGEGER